MMFSKDKGAMILRLLLAESVRFTTGPLVWPEKYPSPIELPNAFEEDTRLMQKTSRKAIVEKRIFSLYQGAFDARPADFVIA